MGRRQALHDPPAEWSEPDVRAAGRERAILSLSSPKRISGQPVPVLTCLEGLSKKCAHANFLLPHVLLVPVRSGKEPILFTTHAAYGQEIHRMQLDSDAPGSRAMPWCSHANMKECSLGIFSAISNPRRLFESVRRKDMQQLVDNSQLAARFP
jgi:hypothetical protein